MQHECRITVLETKVFPEYQEKPVCLHSPPGRIHHAQVDQ